MESGGEMRRARKRKKKIRKDEKREMIVQNVLNVLNVPERLPKLPNLNFGKRSAANLLCLNWGRNSRIGLHYFIGTL